MRFAVLGAGYAGLSVSWHLLFYSQGTATIDLFDPVPIGSGASGLSSGILHSFTGRKAVKPLLAGPALTSAHNLITQASKAINKNLILSKGILRPAVDEEQASIFQQKVKEYPKELEWWEKAQSEIAVPGLSIPNNLGSLYIKDGITIDNESYIEGLWSACANLGTQFYDELIENIADIADFYDHIIITPGAHTDTFPELEKLPINKVKGQLLEITWPDNLPVPAITVNALKYMVMRNDYKTCILGATFEHNQVSEDVDETVAYNEIMPSVISLFPELKNAKVINCYAGLRSSSSTRLPIISKLQDKLWYLGGLGSKGLLYHGLTGDLLAQALLKNSTALIPKEFLFKP